MTATIHAAPEALAVLVTAMRADWNRTEVDGAIQAAGYAGWTWAHTANELVRLASDGESTPRDLTEACRNPIERRGPAVDPAPYAEHARQLMAAALESASEDATEGAA